VLGASFRPGSKPLHLCLHASAAYFPERLRAHHCALATVCAEGSSVAEHFRRIKFETVVSQPSINDKIGIALQCRWLSL
jgi:hypothetical protein